MKQWIKIRKDLFLQVQTHVKALLGSEGLGLKKYQASYEEEFQVRWREAQRNQLLESLNGRRIIGLADFHALQQSQKSHLRILQSLDKKRPRILAVEFFEARYQQALDSYQQGKVTESEFLKTIRWHVSWGFPWEHFKPLVRWAIRNKVRIVGIDQRTPVSSARTLKKRDKFAGQMVAELIHKFPDFQVIVIFGDLHWAEDHLPHEISRQSKLPRSEIVTVFQNSERIYFQLLARSREHSVDVVRLSKNSYCLLNVPPWVKWQNYLLFLEQKYDRELDETEADQTDHIGRYVNLIAKELEVQVGVDHFSIYSAESQAFWSEFKGQVPAGDLKWFRSLVANAVSFYIPGSGVGFLAQSSVNHAAQLAMAIVFASVSKMKLYPAKMPEDFLKLIWLEAVLYFGSKIVNPKRKTDTLVDMKARLAAAMPGDQGLEALRLALQQKMSELVSISHGKRQGGKAGERPREVFAPRKQVSYREAARLLGGMLGEKLFNAYDKKMISRFTLKEFLKKSIENENFRDVYYELVEVIESFPEPFSSKFEKL
jgi:hypothetical protein